MSNASRSAIAMLAASLTFGCNSDEPQPVATPPSEQTAEMPEHILKLELPPEVDERLSEEAKQLGMSREDRVHELLNYGIAPAVNLKPGFIAERLRELKEFIDQIPGVDVISTSEPDEGRWWVKLQIDINSKTAWHVVQNLAFVLNEISVTETLPTTFKPTAPPPYLNGGPEEFLFWVIEADIPFLDPSVITAYLQQRLPDPVADEASWLSE
ncbi:MAG: hypothetical protein Aurels2KO_58160 [Aureliella sp.]